jgi:hypothetical protein
VDSIQVDIQVDVEGLSAFGGLCQHAAERLEADSPIARPGPAFQATTRAVDEVLAAIGRVDSLVGVRLRVTGHSIVTAADRLAHCDDASRAHIDAIPPARTVL